MQAVKKYSGPQGSPVEELETALNVLRNHLQLVSKAWRLIIRKGAPC